MQNFFPTKLSEGALLIDASSFPHYALEAYPAFNTSHAFIVMRLENLLDLIRFGTLKQIFIKIVLT